MPHPTVQVDAWRYATSLTTLVPECVFERRGEMLGLFYGIDKSGMIHQYMLLIFPLFAGKPKEPRATLLITGVDPLSVIDIKHAAYDDVMDRLAFVISVKEETDDNVSDRIAVTDLEGLAGSRYFAVDIKHNCGNHPRVFRLKFYHGDLYSLVGTPQEDLIVDRLAISSGLNPQTLFELDRCFRVDDIDFIVEGEEVLWIRVCYLQSETSLGTLNCFDIGARASFTGNVADRDRRRPTEANQEVYYHPAELRPPLRLVDLNHFSAFCKDDLALRIYAFSDAVAEVGNFDLCEADSSAFERSLFHVMRGEPPTFRMSFFHDSTEVVRFPELIGCDEAAIMESLMLPSNAVCVVAGRDLYQPTEDPNAHSCERERFIHWAEMPSRAPSFVENVTSLDKCAICLGDLSRSADETERKKSALL
ncbi:hypothetical protein FOZ62_011112 [Perkinsus olseni]|uniref:Uncharacterized protein n=1 Tax=Perkinsus olseni TaxID=32597 RepID=A0A7J6R4V3_PEROL|nr:hypothetical protein FOZ62_011112 [Perkinsus olseni]